MPALRPRAFAAYLVALLLLLAPRVAQASFEDASAREAVQQIMTEDYPGSLGPAKKKLQEQLATCVKKSCSPAVKGEIYVALGMVASQLG